MYKSILIDDPGMSIRQIQKKILETLGVGERSINKIITTYSQTKSVASPNPKQNKKSYYDNFDDFSRNAVHRHVPTIWFCREIPTVDKIYQAIFTNKELPQISRTNLFQLLKDLDF